MTNTYAVIDIGTLKVKTLIAEVSKNGNLTEKYSSNTLTCFGCEYGKLGILRELVNSEFQRNR